MKRITWICGFAIVLVAVGCGEDGGGGPTSECGDGVVEGSEQCDDGNQTDGDGCDADCTYSCETDADCDDGRLCNGEETCDTSLHVCRSGSPVDDGTECEFTVVTEPGGDGGVGDGGVGDGGAGDGGTEETILGKCIEGQCGRPCTMDDDCNDGNPCNGEETCNTEHDSCAPGEDLDCDDGERCTEDSCDPESGCVHTLTDDEDGDGFVAEGVECDDPDLEGDCNDDPEMDGAEDYPGATELCDGRDNDCDGDVDETAPIWYLDCDGDGFAASGATDSDPSCDEPDPQSGCGWTTTVPSGVSSTDCDDTNADVHPDHTAWENQPYCEGAGTTASGTSPPYTCSSGSQNWDWDCNENAEKRWAGSNDSEGCTHHPSFCFTDPISGRLICTSPSCSGTGWVVGYDPSCGSSADYRTCRLNRAGDGCIETVAERQQECR